MGFPANQVADFASAVIHLVSIPSRGLWVFPRYSEPNLGYAIGRFNP